MEALFFRQIEPRGLKNFAAQLKEGARTARLLRPQFFSFSLSFSLSLSLWFLLYFCCALFLLCTFRLLCTFMHRFPQKIAASPLAKIMGKLYSHSRLSREALKTSRLN
jgi:hypothetical protein